MTFRDAIHRLSQAANGLLALSLFFALVHYRWSLELFAAGCGLHAVVAVGDALRHNAREQDPAGSLA